MTTASKTHIREQRLRTKLLIPGGILFTVWPIIIASFSGQLFYCGLASAGGCNDAGNWQDTLTLGPTVIGAFILSLGLVYEAKLDRALKILSVIAATIALSFLGYWLTFVWFWIEMWIRNTLAY